mgnify:FL=1
MIKVGKDIQLAIMMAASAMFTLAGYEFMRSASTVLFKNAYGAENLPLLMVAMPVVVFAGVVLYGWLLSKLGPRRTLMVTSYGSALLIFAGYLAVRQGSQVVTPLLFLLKEFYVVLLIEQYWSYINSSLTEQTAKKVNGPITGIAGLGSVLGAYLVSISAVPLGTETLVLLAALALLPAGFVANRAYLRFGEPVLPTPTKKRSSFVNMGWSVLTRNPKLVSLLLIIVSAQVIAAVLDFKFQALLSTDFAGQTDAETAFQGDFWFYLNSVAVASQFLLTPVFLTLFALRFVHLLMPLIHVCAIGYAIWSPSLLSVGMALFIFKVFDYSLFRGAKELIYMPLDFDSRYRAKELIDVLGYRSAKGGSGLVVVFLQKLGVVMSNYYLLIGLMASFIWLALVFPLTNRAGTAKKPE